MMRARMGMTLIELVIGIAITAMMAAAGAVAFTLIIDRRATVSTASTEVERAAALREMIRQWIAEGTILVQRGGAPRNAGGAAGLALRGIQAVTPGSTSRTPVSQQGVTAAASTGNELTFMTSAPNPAMGRDVRIRLFVDADKSTPEEGLTIEYQSSAQTPLQRRMLDSTIADLTIEFYDQRTTRWVASTAAAGVNGIAVRIAFKPAEGHELPRLLQVPITYVYGQVTTP